MDTNQKVVIIFILFQMRTGNDNQQINYRRP